MSSLVYVYGFVPSDSPSPPEDLKGIDGQPVALLRLGAFAAATSELDAGSYGSGPLESRLEDLGWVGQRGIEHERVVTWLSDHATVMPMRLFTLFSSVVSLRDAARERGPNISETLERFQDVREWDLKVSYDLAELRGHMGELSPRTADLEADIAAAAPGRRYLLERKRDDLVLREVPRAARSLAQELLEELRPLVEHVRELELPTHRDGLPVVLDVAFLVHRERVPALRELATERARELHDKGVHAALTGPWAPYRFVREREDA